LSNKSQRLEIDTKNHLIIINVNIDIADDVWETLSDKTKSNIIKYHIEKTLKELT